MARFNELIEQDVPVLIDFYATWCGPCKVLSPIIQSVAQNMSDQIKVYKIDVDKNPELSNQWQIRSVPTLMVFRKGKVLWRQSGALSEGDLTKVMQGFL
jgi:thioredoxin 1